MKALSIFIIIFSAILFLISLFILGGLMALSMFSGSSASLDTPLLIVFVILIVPIILAIIALTVFKEKKVVKLVLNIIGLTILLLYFSLITYFFIDIRSNNMDTNDIEIKKPDF